jgi:hypothetical protein
MFIKDSPHYESKIDEDQEKRKKEEIQYIGSQTHLKPSLRATKLP